MRGVIGRSIAKIFPEVPNDIGQNVTYLKMGDFSCVMRKPVFRVSDPVQHKPGCTATDG